MSSSYARRRRPASVRASNPGVGEFRHTAIANSPGDRLAAADDGNSRAVANVWAVQVQYERPRVALRTDSRLMVLGARPNTLAIIYSEWLWIRIGLNISRSIAVKCVSISFALQHRSPSGPVALHFVRAQALRPAIVSELTASSVGIERGLDLSGISLRQGGVMIEE
jgi:hypothetical protein